LGDLHQEPSLTKRRGLSRLGQSGGIATLKTSNSLSFQLRRLKEFNRITGAEAQISTEFRGFGMKRKAPRKRVDVEHTPQWEHMRAHLPAWVIELSRFPGNDIDSAEFDNRIRPYSERDVCTKCKVDAAFQIQERLRDYRKRFINRESSPYLSTMGVARTCTCKRSVRF
jgi:hypothetical protein